MAGLTSGQVQDVARALCGTVAVARFLTVLRMPGQFNWQIGGLVFR